MPEVIMYMPGELKVKTVLAWKWAMLVTQPLRRARQSPMY